MRGDCSHLRWMVCRQSSLYRCPILCFNDDPNVDERAKVTYHLRILLHEDHGIVDVDVDV